MEHFRFSVFTATYNRASFLPRVYKSLLDQTFKDFEWIVVDDGSTDNTEELIQSYINHGELKQITYVKKENGGKHTAWREATKIFQGKYVVAIDSDDTLTNNALEIFNKYWEELENSHDYDKYWEVKGRVQDENGVLIGPRLPQLTLSSTSQEMTFKYKVKSEMLGCRKKHVLRNEAKVPENFLFDSFCSNLGEIIRWSRAGKRYKTLYFDEIVRTYYFDAPNTLSKSNRLECNINKTYNSLVTSFYLLSENRTEMLKWDLLSYFYNIIVIIYMSFRLNKNPFKLPFENLNFLDFFLMILGYTPVYLAYLIREKYNN